MAGYNVECAHQGRQAGLEARNREQGSKGQVDR
jgi:hypothetical protein